MKSLAFYIALFGIAFVVGSANAMTIEMLNKDDAGNKMIYSEELARVDVGETVTWVPTSPSWRDMKRAARPCRDERA